MVLFPDVSVVVGSVVTPLKELETGPSICTAPTPLFIGLVVVGDTSGKVGGTRKVMVRGVAPAIKPDKRMSLLSDTVIGEIIVALAEMVDVAARTDDAQLRPTEKMTAQKQRYFSDIEGFLIIIGISSRDLSIHTACGFPVQF
jgi:hypothetical protein